MRLKNTTEQQVLHHILKGESLSHLDDVDSDVLFKLFQRHRLFPLASEIIELLDDKNKEKWRNTVQALTLKSLHQTSVLGIIISGFKNQGIEAIPLKGPVLGQHLYGNLGNRHFVDLDILIRGVDMERILEVARGLGFLLRFPKPGLTSKQWDYYFRFKKDIGLENPDQGIFVELHAGIDNHELLNTNEEGLFWKNLAKEKIGGIEFHCMNYENSFLYLAYHGGLHQYVRLFWLRDVAEALKRWEMDHQKILMNAKSLGIERLLGVSLELAAVYFNTEIPDVYQPYLKEDNRIIQRLKNSCMERISGPENLSVSGRIQRQLYILLLKPKFHYKWVVVKSIAHRWYIGKFLGGH